MNTKVGEIQREMRHLRAMDTLRENIIPVEIVDEDITVVDEEGINEGETTRKM